MDIEELSSALRVIDPNKIQMQNRIGRGCQGSVYNAYNQQSMQRYAIKVMNTSGMSEKERQRLQGQIQSNFTLSSKQHFIYFPYFFGYWTTQNQAYLVFQKCEGNALEGINVNRTPASSYSFAYILFYDILNALSLLEQRNIIHRDLKPENILLDKGSFKICDLGLSRIVEKGKRLTINVGNVMSRSPQFYSGIYDCKTDIWSLGINVFWIAFGSLPFNEEVKELIKEKKISDIITKISNKDFTINLGNMQTYMTQIMKIMLEVDSQKRLNASEILKIYFQSANFDKDNLNSQIKYMFFNYLSLRKESYFESKIILIIMLLVIDFTKMDEHLKKQTNTQNSEEQPKKKCEQSRKQIIKRVKFNIFCILRIIFAEEKQYLSQLLTEIIDFYLNIWRRQLESDNKWEKRLEGDVKCIQSCLQLHKLKVVRDKFPLVLEAVKIYRCVEGEQKVKMEQELESCIWKIGGLDLRKFKL